MAPIGLFEASNIEWNQASDYLQFHSYMKACSLQRKFIFDCILIYKTCICLQYVFFFHKGGGGVGYKAQILNTKQDISSMTQHLPLINDKIPWFIVRKSNQSTVNSYRNLKINKENIFLWLQFLIKHYRFILILILELLRRKLIKYQLVEMVIFKVCCWINTRKIGRAVV